MSLRQHISTTHTSITNARGKNCIHGLADSRLASIRESMINRCHNPKKDGYHRYGGRGISVHEGWRASPVAFYNWAMANGYKDDLQIDRINNDGNYEPGNCRWVSPEQNSNNSSKNIFIEHEGKKLTISQWSRMTGISKTTIRYRYHEGWSPSDVLSIPAQRRQRGTPCAQHSHFLQK